MIVCWNCGSAAIVRSIARDEDEGGVCLPCGRPQRSYAWMPKDHPQVGGPRWYAPKRTSWKPG